MLLDEFIRNTLSSILKGVSDSRSDPDTKNHGWVVPPEILTAKYFAVSFDVLVEASSSSKTDGKASVGSSIKIFSGSAGVGKEKKEHNSEASRVKFEVPIKFKHSKS